MSTTLGHCSQAARAEVGVRGYLGSELVLEDSTANLTFSVQQVLARLPHTMTLVIQTSSCNGIGSADNDKLLQKFFRDR